VILDGADRNESNESNRWKKVIAQFKKSRELFGARLHALKRI
jgi:hypothetical protein